MQIKVLSVMQPHADDIVFGDKFVENRSWPMSKDGSAHRPNIDPGEWLYIHASSKWDGPKGVSAGTGLNSAIIGRCKVLDAVSIEELLLLVEDTLGVPTGRKPVLGHAPRTMLDIAKGLRQAFCGDIYKFLRRQNITWELVEKHACGEVCWLLTQRQAIKPFSGVPGKLNIWRHEIAPSQIKVIHRASGA